MTHQPGPNQQNFAEALVASGLVKNVKIAQRIENPKNDTNSESKDSQPTKLASKKRSQSNLDFTAPQRTQNTLKPTVIEDIYLDRQLNAPLPKLRPEGSHLRDGYSENASFRSDSTVSDISFLYDKHNKREESTEISNEDLLRSMAPNEQITFPRTVFAAQTIGKPQIASRANYEQLNNLLQTLTSQVDLDPNASEIDRIVGQKDAFDTVMSEVVRQGFFECSAKGDLLNNVRTYMTSAADQIPVLTNRLQRAKDHAQKKITALTSENEELTTKNNNLVEKNNSIEKTFKTVQTRLNFAEGKIPQLENETRQMRLMKQNIESQLEEVKADLEKRKQKVDKLKSQRLDKLSVIDQLGKEVQSLKEYKEEAQKSIDAMAGDNDKLQKNNDELSKEIKSLKSALENALKQIAEYSEIAISKEGNKQNLSDKTTQTETYATRQNQRNKIQKNKASISDDRKPVKTVEEIRSLKGDYDSCKEIIGDISLESFDKLKEIVLSRNGHFIPNNENLIKSQDGTFEIEDANLDSIKIFAHTLMKRVIDKACISPSRSEKSVQSTIPAVQKVDQSTSVQSHELKQGEFKDNFTKLLDPTYSDRPPRTFEWIIKSLRSVFDEKTVKDANDVAEGRKPAQMPMFTLQWSTRQYGLDYLAHQCCWDLVNTARAHQYKAAEIELFRKFLDEDLSTPQLTFFLRIRAVCLRRGINLSVRSKESDAESYNEVYLTTPTALDIVQKVFQKAGPEIVDATLRAVKNDVVRKPTNTVDQTVTYVSMASLLSRSVDAFQSYETLELKKMMSCCQIKPKIDSQHFTQLVKELIPTANDQTVAELYRLMLSVQKNDKALVTKKKLIAQFNARSLLTKENTPDIFEVEKMHNPTPELDNIKTKWKNLIPKLDEILDLAETREKDPKLMHEMQCLRLEIDNVNGAVACYDVFGAHRNILSCILAYQALVWSLNEPELTIMDNITNSIRDVLRI